MTMAVTEPTYPKSVPVHQGHRVPVRDEIATFLHTLEEFLNRREDRT
jgi:hypothetical protein